MVLLTAGLDARENQATRVVLDAVTGTGALNDVVLPRWQPLVDAMRQASLWKWLASGGWAALLCALAWTQRHAPATPPRGVLGCMLAVLLVAGLVLLGAAAAICLVGGALAGLAASAASASDQTMVALATARRAVQWGFVLALGYPLVLALLTLLHRRNPARRG